MQIPVLIEPIKNKRYRASGAAPFALSAEGATREEALTNLREQLEARLARGSAIVGLEVPTQQHPLAEFVGMFKDDPGIEDWKKSMAEYRRKIDKNPELP